MSAYDDLLRVKALMDRHDGFHDSTGEYHPGEYHPSLPEQVADYLDRTDASDEEFRARFDRFGIFDEERVVEEVARALRTAAHRLAYSDDSDPWPSDDDLRALATAAVARYRSTQDGGAEEAVRRVEALVDRTELAVTEFLGVRGRVRPVNVPSDQILAALAPQAGDGAR